MGTHLRPYEPVKNLPLFFAFEVLEDRLDHEIVDRTVLGICEFNQSLDRPVLKLALGNIDRDLVQKLL